MKITLEVDDPYRLLSILRSAGGNGQPGYWADQIEPQVKAYIVERDTPIIHFPPTARLRPQHWWNR